MLAHSDSEAWDLKPFFVEGPSGRKILFPSHNDTRAPLVREIVEQLEVMCGKLMEAVFEERKRLETELEGVLPSGSVREMLGDCMSGGSVVIGGSLGDSRW